MKYRVLHTKYTSPGGFPVKRRTVMHIVNDVEVITMIVDVLIPSTLIPKYQRSHQILKVFKDKCLIRRHEDIPRDIWISVSNFIAKSENINIKKN